MANPINQHNLKKVLVAGSFDIIHPGHIFLFREASKLGQLHVIVARDSSIQKIKGHFPVLPEDMRLEIVQSIRYVHTAHLGSPSLNFLTKVLEINPDIILLGPNQQVDPDELKKELDIHGFEHIEVKRLTKLYKKYSLWSSSKIKEKIRKMD